MARGESNRQRQQRVYAGLDEIIEGIKQNAIASMQGGGYNEEVMQAALEQGQRQLEAYIQQGIQSGDIKQGSSGRGGMRIPGDMLYEQDLRNYFESQTTQNNFWNGIAGQNFGQQVRRGAEEDAARAFNDSLMQDDYLGLEGISDEYLGLMSNADFAGWKDDVQKLVMNKIYEREGFSDDNLPGARKQADFNEEASRKVHEIFGAAGSPLDPYNTGSPGMIVQRRYNWVQEQRRQGSPQDKERKIQNFMPDSSGRDFYEGLSIMQTSPFKGERDLQGYVDLVKAAVGLVAVCNSTTGEILGSGRAAEYGPGRGARVKAQQIVDFHYSGLNNRSSSFFRQKLLREASEGVSSLDSTGTFTRSDLDFGNIDLSQVGKSPSELGDIAYAYNKECYRLYGDMRLLLRGARIDLDSYASGGEGNGGALVTPEEAEKAINDAEGVRFDQNAPNNDGKPQGSRLRPQAISTARQYLEKWKTDDAALQGINSIWSRYDDGQLADYLESYLIGGSASGDAIEFRTWWEPPSRVQNCWEFVRGYRNDQKLRDTIEQGAVLPGGYNPMPNSSSRRSSGGGNNEGNSGGDGSGGSQTPDLTRNMIEDISVQSPFEGPEY